MAGEKLTVLGREFTKEQMQEILRGHEQRNGLRKRLSAEARELAAAREEQARVSEQLNAALARLEQLGLRNGTSRDADDEIPEDIESAEDAVRVFPRLVKALRAEQAKTRETVAEALRRQSEREAEQRAAQSRMSIEQEIQRLAKEHGVDWRALYFEAARDRHTPLEEIALGLREEIEAGAGDGSDKTDETLGAAAAKKGSADARPDAKTPPNLERPDGAMPETGGRRDSPDIGTEELTQLAHAYLNKLE